MVFLALLVIGFFFPPAWLALAAYAIYFMATKEKRRERIIKGYISNMVSRGVSEADIPELYYESAFGFAKANGAKFEEWEKPFERVVGFQRDFGHTFWVIEEKSSGEILGFCGLKRVNSEGTSMTGQFEIGWRLHPDAWGKGIAKEAAIASLDLAFNRFDAPHVVALTVDENRESWGLMKRLGMTRRPDLDFVDPRYGPELNPVIIYRIDSAQWPAARAAGGRTVGLPEPPSGQQAPDAGAPKRAPRGAGGGAPRRWVGGRKGAGRGGQEGRGFRRRLRPRWLPFPWPREGAGRCRSRRRTGVLNG